MIGLVSVCINDQDSDFKLLCELNRGLQRCGLTGTAL